jgi:hypothetical protein
MNVPQAKVGWPEGRKASAKNGHNSPANRLEGYGGMEYVGEGEFVKTVELGGNA